jgi:hypothetical protein
MAFTVPAVYVTKNSGGSVTTTAGNVTVAVPSGTEVAVGIGASSDAAVVNSVSDSKGNAYTLVGHGAAGASMPVWIYRAAITTSLTTSDTVTVTTAAGTVLNVIGVALPGTVGTESFFSAEGNSQTAAVANVPVQLDAEYVIAFEHNGTNSPTWNSPATSLGLLLGGGGGFFTASYTATSAAAEGATPTAAIPTSAVPWQIASVGTLAHYTDLYQDTYADLYGQFTGTPWPQSGALELSVQANLNGTWTDITDYVYQRDGSVNITITFGRPDESSKLVTAQCKLQLNNRGGTFSAKNSSSPFYPYITRNTQLRVLVPVSYNTTDAGMAYLFTGEVPAWPPSWDASGADVWTDIVASGITRRLNLQATIGSALSRFYLQKDTSDPTYPIAYWTMEDGSTSATLAEFTGNGSAATFTGTPTLASDDSFSGSDPIPVLNGAVITCLTGVFGDTGSAVYTIPGTYTFTPRAGLTSLTSAECWGGGGGGSNGYQANTGQDAAGGGAEYAKETAVAVTAGNPYTVVVGAGGAGGKSSLTITGGVLGSGIRQRPVRGSSGGTSSFAGDAVTVTAHGGGGGTFTGTRAGAGGTGSSNATHHDGAAGGKNSGALYGGSGGGSSGGTAAAGNAGSNGGGSNTGAAGGAAVTGGGAGGKGGNGGPSTDQGGTAGSVPGGGGGSGGENQGNLAAHSGGNGGAGKVKLAWTPLVSPAYNTVRFLLHVPAGGDTNNAVVAQYKTGGKVATVILTYTTASSGSLVLTGKDSGGTLLFTSAAITGINGVPNLISMELIPGATIGYRMSVMPANNPLTATQNTGTASASGSVGAVSEVDVNPAGALSGTALGHLLVQYSFESLGALSGAGNAGLGPVSGWSQEKIGHRFGRLCTEEGIPYQLIGDVEHGVSTSEQMGPQPDAKFMDVMQQLEDLNGGLLFEPASQFGLGYRARADLVAQKPAITGVVADYAQAHLSAPFQPVDDDQLTRNVVTISRTNGSSVIARDVTSALSSLDPPDGVGQYTYSLTVNASADSQLAGVASRVLTLGTVDEYRYPQVNFQLSRSAIAQLFSSLVQMTAGDYLRILNPPSFLGIGTINLLAFGFTITIGAFQLDIALNCVPESPFET